MSIYNHHFCRTRETNFMEVATCTPVSIRTCCAKYTWMSIDNPWLSIDNLRSDFEHSEGGNVHTSRDVYGTYFNKFKWTPVRDSRTYIAALEFEKNRNGCSSHFDHAHVHKGNRIDRHVAPISTKKKHPKNSRCSLYPTRRETN